MPENMSWLEAREAARSGLHVRREAWAASCWLIYQRGVAWYWNGAAWRVVDAPDFGRAEFESTDWTTIPRQLDDCCRVVTFPACDGNTSHYTGFDNPYGVAIPVRMVNTEANAVIELQVGDGPWVTLNQGDAGAEAVWDHVLIYHDGFGNEITPPPSPGPGIAPQWPWVGWKYAIVSPARPRTYEALDYSFTFGGGLHFSIRTMQGKHKVNEPIQITVCFGAQTLPDDGVPTLPGGDEGDDTPPKPPPLPPPIPPRPKPKPICTDYEYPARGASSGEIFGEITISNPYPARARVTITGSVDDELVVNGSRAEGGSRSAHGDVNHSLELGAGESCTIGGADNYGGNVWYNYRVCVERL